MNELFINLPEELERHFGFRTFLEGQESAIQEVLNGRDVVVIMPTGSGKSLCYQLAAMVLPGVTLVVSPLIALMKDQVDGMVAKGVPATFYQFIPLDSGDAGSDGGDGDGGVQVGVCGAGAVSQRTV